MQSLEAKLHEPLADPQAILQLVTVLPSDTVPAPRKISTHLAQRLDHVAKLHKGRVPLHGRLFAQWMHHAFPRECPYPHEAGATNPETPDEWMQSSGHESSESTEEEMQAHIDLDTEEKPKGAEARKHHHFEENELPWSEAEELFNGRGASVRSQPQSPLRTISVFSILCSVS